jgi:hypothetical protein
VQEPTGRDTVRGSMLLASSRIHPIRISSSLGSHIQVHPLKFIQHLVHEQRRSLRMNRGARLSDVIEQSKRNAALLLATPAAKNGTRLSFKVRRVQREWENMHMPEDDRSKTPHHADELQARTATSAPRSYHFAFNIQNVYWSVLYRQQLLEQASTSSGPETLATFSNENHHLRTRWNGRMGGWRWWQRLV